MKTILYFLIIQFIWGCTNSVDKNVYLKYTQTDSTVVLKQRGYGGKSGEYEISSLPLDKFFLFGITDKKDYQPKDKLYAKLFMLNKGFILKDNYKVTPYFKFGNCDEGLYKVLLIKNDTAYIEESIPDSIRIGKFRWCGKFIIELPGGDSIYTFQQDLKLEK